MPAVSRVSITLLSVVVALSEPCAAQIGLPTDIRVDVIVEDAVGERVSVFAHTDDGAGSSELEIVCDGGNQTLILRDVTQSALDLYPALPGFCSSLIETLREQDPETGR
jgi:hypothetical protein